MSEETGHGEEHDGIVENDNLLPRWWLLTLFGAILFSLGYWFYFHKLEGLHQRGELDADEKVLKDAQDRAIASRVNDEVLLASSLDAVTVRRGAEIYKTTCVACHGEQGEGKIGPNLTDAYWLHGGKPAQVFRTVFSGVPEKGMVAWGPTLGAAKVQDVVAYVLTLKNTNVGGGKAPQGEPESPGGAPAPK